MSYPIIFLPLVLQAASQGDFKTAAAAPTGIDDEAVPRAAKKRCSSALAIPSGTPTTQVRCMSSIMLIYS